MLPAQAKDLVESVVCLHKFLLYKGDSKPMIAQISSPVSIEPRNLLNARTDSPLSVRPQWQRDEMAKYFNGEGKLPFQEEACFGRQVVNSH